MKNKTAFLRKVLAAGWIALSSAEANPTQPSGPACPPDSSEASEDILDQKYLGGDFWKQRSTLEDKGFTFTPTYSAEVFGNPAGGVKQGAVYEGLLNLPLTLDFQKMAGWAGSFYVNFYYPMGNSLTSGDTHELMTLSNISAYNTPHLFELWYEQKFLDDKLALRLGQLAADSDFYISGSSALFLAAPYGWPAILGNNVPAPIYDYATPGVRLRVDPDEHWSFQAGVYSGNPAPDRIGDPNPRRTPAHDFNNSGTDFNINGSDGLFSISELSYHLNQEKDARGLPGTYKIGGWLHAGTFSNSRNSDDGLSLADPASDGRPQAMDGNHGFYMIADQAIWQDKSNPDHVRQINLFFRAGNALADRSIFDFNCNGGVVFNGLIPGRPCDAFGVATAYGHMASGVRGKVVDENHFNGTNLPIPDYEQNIEFTYSAEIAQWWTVQPDIQVILHPGGSAAIPDALVLGCRTTITF